MSEQDQEIKAEKPRVQKKKHVWIVNNNSRGASFVTKDGKRINPGQKICLDADEALHWVINGLAGYE